MKQILLQDNLTWCKQLSTREAIYAQCNTEACSRNHCCHGKTISITHFCVYVHAHARVCACSLTYAACNVHAPYCPKKKGKLLNIKCVSRFSLQLLSKIFLIVRSVQHDIIINVKTSSCKVPVILIGF
jgi:hypothetical protein